MLVERISSGIEGLDSGRLLIINTINNLLSGSKAMVEKVNLQRAFAVVIYKKLIVTGQVTKEMDVGARLAVINKTLDIVREKINIDADIMKNALMENDKISFDIDWFHMTADIDTIYPRLTITDNETLRYFIKYTASFL